MSIELFTHNFQSHDVRSSWSNTLNEPVFIGKDVCTVIGITKYRDALAQLDDDERVSVAVDTPGGQQMMVGVTESGIWSLMLISRSPLVKPFRRWLTHTVLPSLRRTGTYSAAPALTGPALMAAALVEAHATLEQKDSQIAVMAPKADYVDMFVATDDLIEFRTLANQLTIKEIDLRTLLIEHNWIYMYSGTRWSSSKKKLITVKQYRSHADKHGYFQLGPEHEAPRVKGRPQQTLFLTPEGSVAVAKAVRRWTSQTDLLGTGLELN